MEEKCLVRKTYLDQILDIGYESCDGVYSHYERKENGRDDQGHEQSPPAQENGQMVSGIHLKGSYHGRPECPV